MTTCYACGHEMNENEPIYTMPVYNVDLNNKKFDAKGYIMCWRCFSVLAMGINAAIFNIRNQKLFCYRGGVKKENKNI